MPNYPARLSSDKISYLPGNCFFRRLLMTVLLLFFPLLLYLLVSFCRKYSVNSVKKRKEEARGKERLRNISWENRQLI
jgi:hypothetical protein